MKNLKGKGVGKSRDFLKELLLNNIIYFDCGIIFLKGQNVNDIMIKNIY